MHIDERSLVQVGVDLGRRDVGVPQKLLHHAEVRPVLDQVRAEGVAENVWFNIFLMPLFRAYPLIIF